MTKKTLRQKYLQKRNDISSVFQKQSSEKICKKLESLFSEINSSITVALFAGINGEVDLLRMLGRSLGYTSRHSDNINFVFPKVTDLEKGEMEFYHIESTDDLEKGTFGILEPKNYCTHIDAKDIDIFCIPSLGIDRKGSRLGMGGGFYDRYLIRAKKDTLKIGVIFSSQIIAESSGEMLTPEQWDIGMDLVITESECLEIHSSLRA